jgi:hypothetical protein
MNTAVHGKASLAEVLLPDGASAGKSADDDRDKTNTVDFGATLTSLIDQTSAGKDSVASSLATSSAARGRGKPSADAPTTFDWSAKKAATALDSSAADAATASAPSAKDATALNIKTTQVDHVFAKVATTSKVGSESHAPATTQEVGSQTSSAPSGSAAALFDAPTLAIHPGEVAADQPNLNQINTSASDGAVSTSKTSRDDANATHSSSDAATGDRAAQSAEIATAAQSGLAVMVDAPVPDTNIAFDQKRQPCSPKATDDPAPASSAQVTSSASDPANVVNPAQIDADADIPITATPRTSDSAQSHSGRADDGTSPALSRQSANSDSMNPADPKSTQQTIANLTADATASSAQQSSQKQMDAVAQLAPQEPRVRTANTKETSSQPAEASSLPNDLAGIVDAQPTARAPEVAAIRLTPEVTSASESSRTVSITVQLASGQTAQASVSERAGAVDVKIVTPTAASAQRVSSEMDSMRQNLDAAGIKLGHSEISYQQGDGKGQGREEYQPPAQHQSANGKEVFTLSEVIQ